MITVKVPEKYNEKKLDKFLTEHFTKLPYSAIFKALRNKDMRINGVKTNKNVVLHTGDSLDIYIKDEILYGFSRENGGSPKTILDIVYEDKNLLLVNKQQGIPVHPDKDPDEKTLIDLAAEYLQKKGEYDPDQPDSFAPSLCHRLDRNTGGIVIIAKNPDVLRVMHDKIKNREIKKFYKCMVQGCPKPLEGELRHFLIKDERKSRVFISDNKVRDSLEIITRYKVVDPGEVMSLLEVELVTGRTHQIRAHLAHIGHPIVGDGKYGTNTFNRKYKTKYQALWAYKVIFDSGNKRDEKDKIFRSNASKGSDSILGYLEGKIFEVKNVSFGIKTE